MSQRQNPVEFILYYEIFFLFYLLMSSDVIKVATRSHIIRFTTTFSQPYTHTRNGIVLNEIFPNHRIDFFLFIAHFINCNNKKEKFKVSRSLMMSAFLEK